MAELYYLSSAFPEPTGFVGEVDWLVRQSPEWAMEIFDVVYPLWNTYWWLCFFYPLYLLLRVLWRAWKLENIVEKKDVVKFKLPAPTAADPKWKWRVWRIGRWLKYWW